MSRKRLTKTNILIAYYCQWVLPLINHFILFYIILAQEGHLECLKWLAKHTGPAIDHVSSDGMTAVHSAAQEGHLECLKFLVVSAGCDGAVKDHANCTPLHFGTRSTSE